MVSSVFNAPAEHGINPTDPEIALDFPFALDELVLSPKDLEAPSLAAAAASGALPVWADVSAHLDRLATQ
jgi:dTDP-4-dehydrorhamnose 3,5-epimerase